MSSDERVVRGRMSAFAAIPAETMNDPRLSMNAAAVLHYMIWRAGIPTWVFCVPDIVNHFNTGKKGVAVRTALVELIELGYVERAQMRDAGGRMIGTRYVVNDVSPTAAAFSVPSSRAGETSEIRRGARMTTELRVVPTPAEEPVPAPVAEGKKPSKAVVSADRAEMYHRILSEWNAIKGRMPGRRARKNDGKYVADKRLARLIDEFVETAGSEEEAVEILKRASVVWNRELDEIPGGWLERSATIELVFSQGPSKGGETVAPRTRRVQQMPVYVAPDVI